MNVSGNLIMRNCYISTRTIETKTRTYLPNLVCMPGSRINLVSCEIKSTEKIMSAGIILLNCDALISNCIVSNFKAGGILI